MTLILVSTLVFGLLFLPAWGEAGLSVPAGTGVSSRFSSSGFMKIRSGEKRFQVHDQGAEVRAAQSALQDLGFPLSACDGKFGPETKRALQAFQAHAGLPEDSVLDACTLEALEAEAPPPGMKLWEMENPCCVPSPWVEVNGVKKLVRLIVVKNEFRTFLFSRDGKLKKIFPNAHGSLESPTRSGLRVVIDKLGAKAVSELGLRSRWKNRAAFGIRLLDLGEMDPITGNVSDVSQELHGTFDGASIGTRASHGCVRHRNEDIVMIYHEVERGDLVLLKDCSHKPVIMLTGFGDLMSVSGEHPEGVNVVLRASPLP